MSGPDDTVELFNQPTPKPSLLLDFLLKKKISFLILKPISRLEKSAARCCIHLIFHKQVL